MGIELFDPVGEVHIPESKPQRALGSLIGKRVGVVFNQHVSAIAFWKAMESEVEKTLKPAGMLRIYKSNTWAPAPRADANRILEETDYVLVGVGA
ncbi:MAG: hypothetical protein ACM3SS_12955 [Rhodospirillaceae bacterium]